MSKSDKYYKSLPRRFRIWNIGKWYILLADFKPKLLNSTRVTRSACMGARLAMLRNRLYRRNSGCCEMCHQHFEKGDMQMHHILPFAVFPELARKKWNVTMLCPRCHYLIHHNPVREMQAMQYVASQHGVNLVAAFDRSSRQKYNQMKADRMNRVNSKI